MIKLNSTNLFAYLRNAPFGGRLTQSQIDGVNAIIKEFNRAGGKDARHLAYILATAFHETGGKMQPVREGFAKTDAAARKIVAKYKYGKPDVNGHVFYGRGHVQLTWAENYKRMGELIGVDLYNAPDMALDKNLSARILVEGMIKGQSGKGDFAGKCVEQYFNATTDDPVGARRIVNGTDKCQLIAGYHKNFLDAIKAAGDWNIAPDITPQEAKADKPNLMKDPATWGTVSAVTGSGIFGAFTAIDSPWAFAAFAVVALGIFLFATGRLQIARKGGV
jgi:putative chitinase